MIYRTIYYALSVIMASQLTAGTAYAEKPVRAGDAGVVRIRITRLITGHTGKLYGTVEIAEKVDEVVDGKKTTRITQRHKLLDIPMSRPFLTERGGYSPDTDRGDTKAELCSNNTGKRMGHHVHKAILKTTLGTSLEIIADLHEIKGAEKAPLIVMDPKQRIVVAGHLTEDARTRGALDFWDDRYSQTMYFKYKDADVKEQIASLAFDIYVQNDFREQSDKPDTAIKK